MLSQDTHQNQCCPAQVNLHAFMILLHTTGRCNHQGVQYTYAEMHLMSCQPVHHVMLKDTQWIARPHSGSASVCSTCLQHGGTK